jgi:hypothetical protein
MSIKRALLALITQPSPQSHGHLVTGAALAPRRGHAPRPPSGRCRRLLRLRGSPGRRRIDAATGGAHRSGARRRACAPHRRARRPMRILGEPAGAERVGRSRATQGLPRRRRLCLRAAHVRLVSRGPVVPFDSVPARAGARRASDRSRRSDSRADRATVASGGRGRARSHEFATGVSGWAGARAPWSASPPQGAPPGAHLRRVERLGASMVTSRVQAAGSCATTSVPATLSNRPRTVPTILCLADHTTKVCGGSSSYVPGAGSVSEAAGPSAGWPRGGGGGPRSPLLRRTHPRKNG